MINNNNIIKQRKRILSPSLSLSYDEPLHIIKGRGQYLYDVEGNEFLDATNNIQHVGQCHPKVIEASKKVIKACEKFGKSCGTQLNNPNKQNIDELFGMGYTYAILGSDLFVLWKWADKMQKIITDFRKN